MCQLNTLTRLFIQHLLSQIPSEVVTKMGQTFYGCWEHIIHVYQVLQYKFIDMIIEPHTRCHISMDMGCIINPRGGNRQGEAKRDSSKNYTCA